MVQMTLNGITFGKTKNVWWDYLYAPSYLTFSYWLGGSNPGTVIINETNIVMNAVVTDDYHNSWIILQLASALTSGRVILNFYNNAINSAHPQSYLKFFVGNDTNGWTQLSSLITHAYPEGTHTEITAGPITIEALYIGNGVWQVYIGNELATEIALSNGFNIQVNVYAESDSYLASATSTLNVFGY